VAADTSLRERKKVRTRDAIVAAALELFADRGYDATTVEMIAEAAEVSPATVFRYFAGKDEIVFSERDRRLPRLAAALRDRPAAESDLVAAGRALGQVFADPDAEARIRRQTQALASSVVLRGKAEEVLADWQETIRQALVARGPGDRADPDARVRAALVMTGFRVALEDWLAGKHPDLVQSIESTMRVVARVARGWGGIDMSKGG
jgi:AcrR family transcriptional regulator